MSLVIPPVNRELKRRVPVECSNRSKVEKPSVTNIKRKKTLQKVKQRLAKKVKWHTGNIRTSKIDGNCFFNPNYGVCEHDQQLECLVNLRKAERALGRKEDDPYQMIMLGLNFF